MHRAVSWLLTGLLTTATLVVGISSPASAAINRCGADYTSKTAWRIFSGDDTTPYVVKFRLRGVPGTQRVCAEFSRFNTDDFRVKDAQIQISQGDDSKKVCFAKYCKFRTGYKTTSFLFAVMAKERGTNQPFYSYTDSIRLTY